MKKAVIGLLFGDEGKGLVVDHLTSISKDIPLIVRFSGGHQAGHNVTIGNKNHIFSNFGSGTLRGAPTYWSKFCTVDPVGLLREYDILIEKGINPILFIDGESPVTTPYDKFHNSSNENDLTHGTCGLGVGSTLNREEHHYSLTFSDIFYPWVLDTKLKSIKEFYGGWSIGEFVSEIDEFLSSCFSIVNNPNIKITYGIPEIYRNSDNIIFEGSQGLLLDQWYGFFPHVARTNTGSKNILDITKDSNIEFYLVTRAYQTRHGNGPMTNSDLDHTIKDDPRETNVNNKYQGEFRKAILDLSLLEYSLKKDKCIRETDNKTLVITCLDHITDYVFTYEDRLVYCLDEKEFLDRISDILKIKRILISKSPYSEEIYSM